MPIFRLELERIEDAITFVEASSAQHAAALLSARLSSVTFQQSHNLTNLLLLIPFE